MSIFVITLTTALNHIMNRDTLIQAIHERHSVRIYDETKQVPTDILDPLVSRIDEINRNHPELNFLLVRDDPTAFGGWASYGAFKGVRNYIVIAGNNGKEIDLLCGMKGEELVLFLQSMGLSTCWVGLTFKKNKEVVKLRANDKIRCLIALGYAADSNIRKHKIKTLQQVSNITEESPLWFRTGVEMALLAPTAVNQQKFRFDLNVDGNVVAHAGRSIVGYTVIDLGIAITHFLIGSGKDYSILHSEF